MTKMLMLSAKQERITAKSVRLEWLIARLISLIEAKRRRLPAKRKYSQEHSR